MSKENRIRVWQFSDTHLYADPESVFHGVNPDQALQGLLAALAARGDHADLAVVTGDLTHDGTEAAYRRLREHFATLGMPVYCLAGNHDDPVTLKRVLASGQVSAPPSVLLAHWQLIMLDTTVPGEDAGRLEATELDRLGACLDAYPERHVVVCLHHPPMPSGMRWMDETMLLRNPEDLFAVLDQYPQVRALLWGHIHQPFRELRRGVHCLAAPSTMVQFLPGSEEFAVDPRPPGLRWLVLHSDGRIETGIERASAAD